MGVEHELVGGPPSTTRATRSWHSSPASRSSSDAGSAVGSQCRDRVGVAVAAVDLARCAGPTLRGLLPRLTRRPGRCSTIAARRARCARPGMSIAPERVFRVSRTPFPSAGRLRRVMLSCRSRAPHVDGHGGEAPGMTGSRKTLAEWYSVKRHVLKCWAHKHPSVQTPCCASHSVRVELWFPCDGRRQSRSRFSCSCSTAAPSRRELAAGGLHFTECAAARNILSARRAQATKRAPLVGVPLLGVASPTEIAMTTALSTAGHRSGCAGIAEPAAAPLRDFEECI